MVGRRRALIVTLFIVGLGCAPEPEGLCEEPEAGETGGLMGVELIGVEAPSLEVRQPAQRLGSQQLELDAGPADTVPTLAGLDGRQPVLDAEVLQSYPLRTIVQTELRYFDGFTTAHEKGTGFLVGPRHVLTNHHVAAGEDNEYASINQWLESPPAGFYFRVLPGRLPDALLNGGVWNVERVIWGPYAFTELYWSGEDYALLVLEDDPDRSGVLGRVGMCSPSSTTLMELSVSSAGFPGSRYPCTNSPNAGPDGCSCGGWMYTQQCELLANNSYPQEFGHDCVTHKGQSGSPLWASQCDTELGMCAIGLHWGTLGGQARAKRLDLETVAYLQHAICETGSQYAPSPSFCG